MSIDSFRSSLLDVVLSLTREGCLPIRVMAIRRLLWVHSILSEATFFDTIFPALEPLVQERSTELSEALLPLVITLMTINKHLAKPLFEQLMEQTTDGIQLFCIFHYHRVFHSDELLERLVVARDLDLCGWRVREAIATAAGTILGVLVDAESRHVGRVVDIYMRLFTDAAHNVRMACAGSVADVLRVMGRDWGEKDFLPFLQCLFKEQHSSVKVTLLYAIQNVMEMDHLEEDLLPEKRMVIDALSNVVPNVRFVACRVIQKTYSRFPKGLQTDYILPKLQAMVRDEDSDVRIFSKETLHSVLS
ncbi:hypothetical protein WA588_000111, partial [Blastocystis sp. NMH]